MREAEAKSRQLGVVVLVALLGLGVAIFASRQGVGRMSNLALPGQFPEVYVQFKVGDASRCLVTDRAGSTARRSDDDLQPARWNCRASGPQGEALLALDGARASFLFVPYEKVVDPVFPFLYEDVRRDPSEPALPRLRWVQLFVNRIYRGFFLQATLPTKDFFEEKQLGELEMLVVAGDELYCFDRKLRGLCPIYSGLVAESKFPQPAWPAGARELAALLPPDLPRGFVLSDKALADLSLADNQPAGFRAWPLPFALPALVDAEAKPYYDQRLAGWRSPAERVSAWPPSKAPGPALDLDPARIEQRLREALAAACAVRGCDADELGSRIAASPSLAALRGRGR